MEGSTKPPQISEMFQKFAIAFKAKTIEFFAEEDEPSAATATTEDFTLLDSAEEEFIPDQKVVVIKPDPTTRNPSSPNYSSPPINPQFAESLISSLFATLSSFEASYLQLQTAHVPFDEETITTTDKALVSHFHRVSDLRRIYTNSRRSPCFNFDSVIGSSLEAQVQENQSKLRALETMFNRLQADIDVKDDEVLVLKKKSGEIQQENFRLSTRLTKNLRSNSPADVELILRVFDSMLRDACKSSYRFTKLLINLMKRAGWDLDLAANSVYFDVEYSKNGHNRYAFLSFVSLAMFRGFDSESFGLDGEEEVFCNGDSHNRSKNSSLRQLIEHVAGNPMEILSMNPKCDFSRFCEKKYEQLIHPTMESSIFRNFDRREAVLDSWRSLSVFYQSFVKMSSSIWVLHKLAYSFNPMVEIFQVERGADFSMVYMEDVARKGKGTLPSKYRPKVGFTVVPGFKIGKTIIQAQVYLTSLKCTE